VNDEYGKLADVRERIRLKLKELEEQEAYLTNMLEGLKSYIVHVQGLLEKVKNSSSFQVLEEVRRLGDLKTRPKQGFFKMSKYAIEKELEEKLREAEKEQEELVSKIETIKQKKEDANVCPDCMGQGKIIEKWYEREDRIIRPMIRVKRCSLCGGKGRISFS